MDFDSEEQSSAAGFGIPKQVDLDRMTKQQLIENVPARTRIGILVNVGGAIWLR
jgi:hypothetical protein